MPRHEAAQMVAPERPHPLGHAEDRAADGLVGIGHLLQPVEDDVVGGVQRLADFLQDDAALHLDLSGVEGGMQHDVRQQVQRQRHVGGQHAGVIGRHLARGVGVDVPADVLDLLGDGQGGAAGGALERHVFEEMRDAVFGRVLVAGTRVDPDAHGRRGQPRHRLGDDAQAVGQGGQARRDLGQGGQAGHAARLSRTKSWSVARSSGRWVTRSGR